MPGRYDRKNYQPRIAQFHWPIHTMRGRNIHVNIIKIINKNFFIIVTCFFFVSDGVGRSGAFLCIHSQLERLKTEGEIDVFKYLKSARTKRIGLVSEMVLNIDTLYSIVQCTISFSL